MSNASLSPDDDRVEEFDVSFSFSLLSLLKGRQAGRQAGTQAGR
jgi:hypothetical protein